MHAMRKTFALIALGLALSVSGFALEYSDYFRYIPDNAVGVLSIDLYQLSEKSEIASFTNQIRQLMESGSDSSNISAALSETRDMGVNFTNRAHIFVTLKGSNVASIMDDPEDSLDFYGIYPLEDQAKWEAFLARNITNGASLIRSSGNFRYMATNNAVIGWNGEVIIVHFGSSEEGNEARAIRPLFSLDESRSLKANRDFIAFEGKNWDIGAWINFSHFVTAIQQTAGSDMPLDAESLAILSNTCYTLSVLFDKGSASLMMDATINTNNLKLDYPNPNKPFSTNLLSKLPGKGLLGFMTWAMNMDYVRYSIKKLNPKYAEAVKEVTESEDWKAIAGKMKLSDIIDIFGGDFAVLAQTDKKKMENISLFAGVTLFKEKNLKTILDNMAKMKMLTKKKEAGNDTYTLKDSGLAKIIKMQIRKGIFYVYTQDWEKAILSGTTSKPPLTSEHQAFIRTNMYSLFVDSDVVLDLLEAESKGSMDEEGGVIVKMVRENISALTMTGNAPDQTQGNVTVSLIWKKKEKNSLYYITQYASDIARDEAEKDRKRKEEMEKLLNNEEGK